MARFGVKLARRATYLWPGMSRPCRAIWDALPIAYCIQNVTMIRFRYNDADVHMLTQLRYFRAIIEHEGLTAAAHVLGVSQPTLTRSLKTLEFELDAKLMDRASGIIKLTPAGEVVLNRAHILLAEHKSLVADIKRLKIADHPMMYVNVSPVASLSILPKILSRMAVEVPECPVSVRGDNGLNYAWKRDALLSGDLDLIITLHDPYLANDSLIQEVFVEPVVKVLGRKDHPFLGSGSMDLSELLPCRWILPPVGSSPRAVLENQFKMQGLEPPRNSIEISDWRIALELIKETDFITAFPYHPATFPASFRDLAIFPTTFMSRSVALSMVTRSASRVREATQAFVRCARAIVEEHGGITCVLDAWDGRGRPDLIPCSNDASAAVRA